MKFNYLAFCMAITVFPGCASNGTSDTSITESKPYLAKDQQEAWGLMLGRWYGSQPTKDGGRKEEIVDKMPNGTYQIRFKITGTDGSVRESAEVGQWGMSGDIYFSIFRGWLRDGAMKPSDPSDPYNYDAYRILKLDSENFEYQHVTTGNKYTSKKVDKNFEFPAL